MYMYQIQFFPCIEPDPKFDMTMYTVPEDDRTTPMLCIDISVMILEAVTYNIDTAPKSPAEAEGKNRFCLTSS